MSNARIFLDLSADASSSATEVAEVIVDELEMITFLDDAQGEMQDARPLRRAVARQERDLSRRLEEIAIAYEEEQEEGRDAGLQFGGSEALLESSFVEVVDVDSEEGEVECEVIERGELDDIICGDVKSVGEEKKRGVMKREDVGDDLTNRERARKRGRERGSVRCKGKRRRINGPIHPFFDKYRVDAASDPSSGRDEASWEDCDASASDESSEEPPKLRPLEPIDPWHVSNFNKLNGCKYDVHGVAPHVYVAIATDDQISCPLCRRSIRTCRSILIAIGCDGRALLCCERGTEGTIRCGYRWYSGNMPPNMDRLPAVLDRYEGVRWEACEVMEDSQVMEGEDQDTDEDTLGEDEYVDLDLISEKTDEMTEDPTGASMSADLPLDSPDRAVNPTFLQYPDVMAEADRPDLPPYLDRRVVCESHFQTEHFRRNMRDMTVTSPVLLAVRSAMGTGKTRALQEWLGELDYSEKAWKSDTADLPFDQVMILTSRRTLARHFEERFRGFQCYLDYTTRMIGEELPLIVEIESLARVQVLDESWRYLVILDECVELLSSFTSAETHKKMYTHNARAFRRFLRRAVGVVAMDAHMDAAAVRLLLDLMQRKTRACFVHNTFLPGRAHNARILRVEKRMHAVQLVQRVLERGCRVWITTGYGPKYAMALYRLLDQRGFRGVCVTGKTPPEEKQEILEHLEQTLPGMHFLVATPVISTGLSYEVRGHIDVVCGIFPGGSVSARSALQQLLRCRDVRRREYLLFLGGGCGRTHQLPKTKEEIIHHVTYTEQALREVQFLDWEPAAERGRVYYRDVLGLHLWAYGKRLVNESRMDFAGTFLALAERMYGMSVQDVVGEDVVSLVGEAEGNAMREHMRAQERDVVAGEVRKMVQAEVIDRGRYDELDTIQRDEEARMLTEGERSSMRLFELLATYHLEGDADIHVTEEMVKKLSHPRAKKVFAILSRLKRSSRDGGVLGALEVVQRQETRKHDRGLTTGRLHLTDAIKPALATDIASAVRVLDVFGLGEMVRWSLDAWEPHVKRKERANMIVVERGRVEEILAEVRRGEDPLGRKAHCERHRRVVKEWKDRQDMMRWVNTFMLAPFLGVRIRCVNHRRGEYAVFADRKVDFVWSGAYGVGL